MTDSEQINNAQPDTKTEQAVVDRFEGEIAVLYLEGDLRMDAPRSCLPSGLREGHYLTLVLDGEQIVSAEIDEAGTETARHRIQEKLNRLRRGEHLQDS